ncbi:hypothetical protein A3196_14940 [Candidatus Thiodiazotropha endoloripes]|uniref:Uncharacterized protein n=1 Tax=Candidatus Thiodiazotropha endoloripes TaxID=1818881 RepID=A0A1E2UTD9_9GAMM|nr:hypothetical protein A3196_14940 [Candidatus Thiodiazotropha endoloripes]
MVYLRPHPYSNLIVTIQEAALFCGHLNGYSPAFGVSKGEKFHSPLWSALKIALFRADLNSYI